MPAIKSTFFNDHQLYLEVKNNSVKLIYRNLFVITEHKTLLSLLDNSCAISIYLILKPFSKYKCHSFEGMHLENALQSKNNPKIPLTLSDTGFFELQKRGWDFCSPYPNFFSRAAVMFNLDSSITNRTRVHKIIQNYELTQASQLWRHSLTYMIKNLFCLFRCHKTSWSQ